ncbi:uncharacterized protein UDID_18876 [Ustilago sp. UG-2017a]|nr:uncharacterized protein UDID_18876 [Ustilago sp. UG-2017a]
MTTSTDDSLDISAQLSATGKKNFTWSDADVLHLVTILYNSESYQHALLPSRESAESDPALKLCKHPIFREISKLIFPGTSVEPNHIKAKLRWLQETYYREKKKLSLTGAGTLLEDMDASNPSYISRLALSTKYTWFEKMHKMMNDRFYADPAALITTPSLDFTSDDKADMPSYSSADIPMDLSGRKPYDHGAHGHGVRGRAPETQVGLSRYSVTIKLCDSYCLGIGLDELIARRLSSCAMGGVCVYAIWTTAFGSIYIRTANLLGAPSDISGVGSFDTAPPPQDLLAGLLYTAPPPLTGDGSFGSYLSSP